MPFPRSLTTTVFSQRSTRRFEASPRRATPKGQFLHLPNSIINHESRLPHRTPFDVRDTQDGKDTPGVIEFYYGEMELRRKGSEPEKYLIHAYWLVSGYASRARRALLTIVGLVIVLSIILNAWASTAQQAFNVDQARPGTWPGRLPK